MGKKTQPKKIMKFSFKKKLIHHSAVRKQKIPKHTLFSSLMGHIYQARENPGLLYLVSKLDAQTTLAVASRDVVTKQMLPLKCW